MRKKHDVDSVGKPPPPLTLFKQGHCALEFGGPPCRTCRRRGHHTASTTAGTASADTTIVARAHHRRYRLAGLSRRRANRLTHHRRGTWQDHAGSCCWYGCGCGGRSSTICSGRPVSCRRDDCRPACAVCVTPPVCCGGDGSCGGVGGGGGGGGSGGADLGYFFGTPGLSGGFSFFLGRCCWAAPFSSSFTSLSRLWLMYR